jgi:hypothetical protein
MKLWAIALTIICAAFSAWVIRYQWRDLKRRQARRRDAFNQQMFKHYVQDREYDASHGLALYAMRGDPDLDPEAYDSTWEYAEVVREYYDLPSTGDLSALPMTFSHDGVQHRVAVLAVYELRVPVLFCNADRALSRHDFAACVDDGVVGCLRCLAKEQEHDDVA